MPESKLVADIASCQGDNVDRKENDSDTSDGEQPTPYEAVLALADINRLNAWIWTDHVLVILQAKGAECTSRQQLKAFMTNCAAFVAGATAVTSRHMARRAPHGLRICKTGHWVIIIALRCLNTLEIAKASRLSAQVRATCRTVSIFRVSGEALHAVRSHGSCAIDVSPLFQQAVGDEIAVIGKKVASVGMITRRLGQEIRGAKSRAS
mmetsp:Transcript_17781/g.41425  ORF Transcript_17781/g.41425 Transcript_17781/m.41425 type:complete len:208 (-) Transcript_17781:134-757(-)